MVYIPLTDTSKQITSYFLLGLDENGPLINNGDKGTFHLTNDGTDWNKPTGTYAKELIEANKRLPGTGQKPAPDKRPDGLIFSLDLRSGEKMQPVLEKLIKTVNQKNKTSFKSAQYSDLTYHHYTNGDNNSLDLSLIDVSDPNLEQTLSIGIVGDRLLISLAGDDQAWKKAVDVSLDHTGGLLQDESMTAVVKAFKPDAMWAYLHHAVLEQIGKDLSESSEPVEKSILHGSGLGFDLDRKGLYLNNFNAYLPTISAEQKQIASLDSTETESLLKLLQAAPAEPLFF